MAARPQFREYLYPRSHPRLAGLGDLNPYDYADKMLQDSVVGDILRAWLDIFETTKFAGVTTDGRVVPDLFLLGGAEGAPTIEAVDAAQRLIEGLSDDERRSILHPLDTKVWRAWMNPEIYVNRFGVRLEELSTTSLDRVLELIESCVSPAGSEKIRDIMRVNGFLGELVELPRLLNELSYNVNIFGTPSYDEPWGWSLYGHHLSLNCIFVGEQQVFTPVFFGAEPALIDSGAHAGTTVFSAEEQAGLDLIRSLSPELMSQAVLYSAKRDPAMPPGRLHIADELNLAGVFQDSRVIPYEGVRLGKCTGLTQDLALALIEVHLGYQQLGPRTARLSDAKTHLDDTWFCWIGGQGEDDVFYYRLQSPVILIELDHHAGVFLSNTEPQRFHVHTVVRTPNGNDYGGQLVRQATGLPYRLDGPA